MSTAEIATVETRVVARAAEDDEWSVERMIAQSRKIQQCMEAVMIRDEHYGVIPGTQGRDGKPPKPTLLKAGAEKLCLMFRLSPEYEIVSSTETSALISFTIRCLLKHIPTGAIIATGLGSCNSREAKYVRPAPKKCPQCGGEFLIFGKQEYETDLAYKGGMMCFKKKGGCGAKFKPDDEVIAKQPTGIADPADLHNTILKMGCKRSLVAAVLNGTAASDCFSQDLDDLSEKAAEYTPPAAKEEAKAGGPKDASVATAAKSTATAGTMKSSTTTSHSGGTATGTKEYVPANKIPVKVGDVMANAAQVDRINELRVQCLDEQSFRLTWLAAYKKHDGVRCEKPADLTFDQASNLLKRMTAHAGRQASRMERNDAEVAANLGAVVGNGKPEATLEGALMKTFRFPDDERAWVRDLFGKESAADLDTKDSEAALRLLLAGYESPLYVELLNKMKIMGVVA